MFVIVISMFTAICWCNSYNLILGCTPSGEGYNTYFLYMIYYAIVAVFTELHSQKWIRISLFELVVTCIETHIFVISFSISHVYISIVNFSVVS